MSPSTRERRQLLRRRSPLWLPFLTRAAVTAAAAGCVFAGSGMVIGAPERARASSPAVSRAIGGSALASSGVVVDIPGSTPPLPEVAASSFVVADLTSGDVLAAKSAHERLPPASTLKMLMADVLLPRLDLTANYVGTAADALAEGSKVGVDPGLTYTVDQLFQGLLLMSGNDAARALASIAGGEPATVTLMAERASYLQALDTSVVNVSGLDAPGQLTSAYDLALIARDAMKNASFRAYVAQRTGEFPGRDGGSYQIQNLNRLLGSYDGAIGIKPGFTTLGRSTFVGAATRDGRTMLVTVMRVDGRGEVPAAALLDWAFAAQRSAEPVGTLVDPTDRATSTPTASTATPTTTATVVPARREPSVAAEPSSASAGIARGVVALVGVTVVTAVGLRVRVRRRLAATRRSR